MSKAKILVVEDEGIVQMDIRRSLNTLGYQVVGGAVTGETAIRKAGELLPDLVLMDIRLAGEMDGIQAAEEIRKCYRLPVIFMTAFADDDTLQRARVTEAFGYILKPFEERELSANIEMAIYKHRAEQKLRDNEAMFLRSVIESSLDGIFLIDSEGRCAIVNAAACEMLGYARDEIQGADCSLLFFAEDIQNTIQCGLQVWPETSDLVERRMRSKTGAEIHLDVKTTSLVLGGNHYTLITTRNAHGVRRDAAVVMDSDKPEATPEMPALPSSTKWIGKQSFQEKFHDVLTGLSNRALFIDRLARVIELSNRKDDYAYAVLSLDIDQFKVVNNCLGNAVGDGLLVAIARLLEDCVRSIDTVARLEADSFSILLEDIGSLQDAMRVTERIQHAFQTPLQVGDHNIHTSASIGIVFSNRGYERTGDILRDADLALYRAKTLGQSRTVIFEPQMLRQAVARLEMETALHLALERRELELYYQPILCFATNQVAGLEALLRWCHPVQGFILPGQFIPVAEETGLILPIGEWVLNEACRQMREWQIRIPGINSIYVSVNVSGKQLLRAEFVDHVLNALRDTGMEAENLRLEITESTLIETNAAIMDMLKRLNCHGIQLYIDDFGIGYSSLSYIQRFPVSTVKIDRSFVKNISGDSNNELIQSILRFTHDLGLKAIAEGVETSHQFERLKAMRCNFGQGYYISVPLDIKTAEKYLTNSTRFFL